MIVCSCNVLTDTAIREVCARETDAPRSTGAVYRCLGCSPQCGRCARTVRALLQETVALCGESCAECPANRIVMALEEAAFEALPEPEALAVD